MKLGWWRLVAEMVLCLALTACGSGEAAQPSEGSAVPDRSYEQTDTSVEPESALEPEAGAESAPAEESAEEQSPWLGTWWCDNGESLVVTAVSDECVSVIYNVWTERGDELIHSDYEMAFQDTEHLVCGAPASSSWDYVLHLEGDQIRMESRYPDRYFYREDEVSEHEPFYGIWCSASKDEQEARLAADGYREQGLDARVYLTTDWSGLNPEPWYVVSAGAYRTEAEAQQALAAAQSVQPDAYIKYSGTWQG